MQGALCNRCPLWARWCLDCGGKACRKASKEAGFDFKPTVYEKLQDMSIEELADWLYANCEWLSTEYGDCSGANDCLHLLEFLNSADED